MSRRPRFFTRAVSITEIATALALAVFIPAVLSTAGGRTLPAAVIRKLPLPVKVTLPKGRPSLLKRNAGTSRSSSSPATVQQLPSSPAGVDLVVSSVTLNPSTRRLRIVIRNQGGSALETPSGQMLRIDTKRPGEQWSSAYIGRALPRGTITAGGNVTHDEPSGYELQGMRVVRVTVDSSSQVEETNEGNNTWEGTFGPDLAVPSVTVNASTRRLGVVIRNDGNMSMEMPANQMLRIDMRRLSEGWGEGYIGRALPSGTLLPGASITHDEPSGYELQGARVVRVTVDSASRVDETNENNNLWEGTLGPDLVVSSVTVNPATGRLRIVIRNEGTMAFDMPGNQMLRIDMRRTDEGWRDSYIGRALPSGTVAPGASITHDEPSGYELQGARVVRVTVDSTSRVDETNENNNVWEGTLTP